MDFETFSAYFKDYTEADKYILKIDNLFQSDIYSGPLGVLMDDFLYCLFECVNPDFDTDDDAICDFAWGMIYKDELNNENLNKLYHMIKGE